MGASRPSIEVRSWPFSTPDQGASAQRDPVAGPGVRAAAGVSLGSCPRALGTLALTTALVKVLAADAPDPRTRGQRTRIFNQRLLALWLPVLRSRWLSSLASLGSSRVLRRSCSSRPRRPLLSWKSGSWGAGAGQVRPEPPGAQLRPGAGSHLRPQVGGSLVTGPGPGGLGARSQPRPHPGSGRAHGGRRRRDRRLGAGPPAAHHGQGTLLQVPAETRLLGRGPSVRAAGEGRVGNLGEFGRRGAERGT